MGSNIEGKKRRSGPLHMNNSIGAKGTPMIKHRVIKHLALSLVTAGLLIISAAAQTAQSGTSTTTPSQTTGDTTVHKKHHHKGFMSQYASDPRVQELKAKQKSEREACKTNASAADCATLKTRQKSEREALKRTLQAENGGGKKKKNG
jgi:hypothetical protein